MAYEDRQQFLDEMDMHTYEQESVAYRRWASSVPATPTSSIDYIELMSVLDYKPLDSITSKDIYSAASRWVQDYSGTPADIARVAEILQEVVHRASSNPR